MISLMQAIKSKTSSDFNTANTEDYGTQVSSKAFDNEDFFDKICHEEEPSHKN